MKKKEIKYNYTNADGKGIILEIEDNLDFFNSELLNIGNLKTPSKTIDSLAVIFDLEGFTAFTRQVDPKLAIPNFVSDFFEWLFQKVKEELYVENNPKELWAELPFFSKFLGDGVLFLWKIDTDKIANLKDNMSSFNITEIVQELICNIIATLYDICEAYEDFLNEREYMYVDPPTKLRCGIARGDVFSLGSGKDFVGPCINISSRLQKFNGLSFGVSSRGIDDNHFHPDYKKDFIKKRVSIRGIGENEIVYVLKSEYEKLSIENKKLFK